jgi:hypothetical protein
MHFICFGPKRKNNVDRIGMPQGLERIKVKLGWETLLAMLPCGFLKVLWASQIKGWCDHSIFLKTSTLFSHRLSDYISML